MKLSKLFHTLYATVMALPVLIIPIFALNILHKETEPISIEVQEQMSIDFNQLVLDTNKDFTNTITDTRSQSNIVLDSYARNGTYLTSYGFTAIHGSGDYIIRTIVPNTNLEPYNFRMRISGQFANIFFIDQNIPQIENNDIILIKFYANSMDPTVVGGIEIYNQEIFNLTQMFGEGNEPTINEFINLFPNSYYEYTVSQKMLVNKPTTTYNSTDIGSQFIYSLYIPVHDYFNFGEFFGLGGMYDWFQLNIFNGTTPLSFFIVFNVMIYWLFISLFWLLFDILIYVPMVIHKWLDKAEM